jgi:hypothetical protein
MTVNKLFCLGIESSFPAADTRMPDHQQKAVRQDTWLFVPLCLLLAVGCLVAALSER